MVEVWDAEIQTGNGYIKEKFDRWTDRPMWGSNPKLNTHTVKYGKHLAFKRPNSPFQHCKLGKNFSFFFFTVVSPEHNYIHLYLKDTFIGLFQRWVLLYLYCFFTCLWGGSVSKDSKQAWNSTREKWSSAMVTFLSRSCREISRIRHIHYRYH